MKNKLELGSQIDINAVLNGGAIDGSVSYSVPANQQDIIEVDAGGIVTALAIGTATVEVKDAASGNLLRAVVFQVLSANDFAAQEDLDTGVTDLQVEFVNINLPTNVAGTDEGDNYVAITFTNTMAVVNRSFQVGIRAVGSGASSTSAAGRFEYQTSSFSGIGPHTVQLLSAVADGVYEVYVQDLVNMTIGSAQVTINTEDLTAPTALVSANWSPYTNLITLSWSASDPETGIVSKQLDLRSQNGSSILINNQNVTADADSTMTAYIEPNDTTYTATLIAINGDGLSKTTTTTVVVPPEPNEPTLVSGTDNGDNTITISWTNSVWAKTDSYQVGLRPAGVKGNVFTIGGTLLYSGAFAHPDAVTTVGPLTYLLNVPNYIPSGTYEVWVFDLTSLKGKYTEVAYVRHDTTAPTVVVTGSWQNGQFTINWTATDDESAIASKVLDIRTADGSTILLNNAAVTGSSTTIDHAADGKTYVVTFKATNAEGLQAQNATSIVVPPPQSLPYDLSAAQNYRSTDITVSWATNYSVINRTFEVKLQTSGGAHINAVNKTVSGNGPFSQVISIGAPATGTYRAVITDSLTGESLNTTFSYTVPPTLMRVNPYMNSNTTRYPYNSYQPPSMADTLPAGVASVSSYYDNNTAYDAWTAFNAERYGGWVSNAASPQWLQYSFTTPTEISGYTLTGRAADDSHLEDFQLQGSNDGSTWTTLDTRTGQQNLGNIFSPKTFMLATDATYTHYRLLVTKVGQYGFYHGAINQRIATLAEMDLLGYR